LSGRASCFYIKISSTVRGFLNNQNFFSYSLYTIRLLIVLF
jgi:hypothetical protein